MVHETFVDNFLKRLVFSDEVAYEATEKFLEPEQRLIVSVFRSAVRERDVEYILSDTFDWHVDLLYYLDTETLRDKLLEAMR